MTLDYLLFFLNIFLTIAYATSIICAYFLFRVRGGGVFIAMGILFFLYFIDNTIIFMTEFIPSFNPIYTAIFETSPVLKAALHVGIVFCYIIFHCAALQKPIGAAGFILTAVYAVALFSAPLIPHVVVSKWVFYLPTQLAIGGLAVFGYIWVKRHPSEYLRTFYAFYKKLCILLVIMNLVIILEDTYVIFFVDNYARTVPDVFYRSVTEGIMVLVLSGMLQRFTRSVLMNRDVSIFGPVVVPPKNVISTMDAFCLLSSLTDRERDVLTELLGSYTISEISRTLYISEGTVKTHIHNLYRKVGVARKNELIRNYTAFEAELQQADPPPTKKRKEKVNV